MADFSYIAIDKKGTLIRGTLAVSSELEVAKKLSSRNLELISCQIQENKGLADLDVGAVFKNLAFRRTTSLEKVSFAHHLSIMLKTGVPIIEAVDILNTEATSSEYKKLIKQLGGELEKGKSLSSFLQKSNFFSKAHLAILKAGEAAGKVTESLKQIGDDLKRDNRVIKKVKGAMAYPAIIMLALMGISGFIVVFVLPKVGEVFKQMNLQLPLPTKILLGLGTFISQNLILILVASAVVGFITFFVFKITGIGEKIIGNILPVLPLVKKLLYEVSLARFVRSLSSLLAAGVSVGESLSISSEIFISSKRRRIIVEVGERVKKGVTLTQAFKKHQKSFGGLLVKMCSIGEKSGRLAEVLEELAIFYEEEVADRLENFASIIEPILMLIVGFGVGAMILSIIAPIYQMMGSLTMQ